MLSSSCREAAPPLSDLRDRSTPARRASFARRRRAGSRAPRFLLNRRKHLGRDRLLVGGEPRWQRLRRQGARAECTVVPQHFRAGFAVCPQQRPSRTELGRARVGPVNRRPCTLAVKRLRRYGRGSDRMGSSLNGVTSGITRPRHRSDENTGTRDAICREIFARLACVSRHHALPRQTGSCDHPGNG